VTPNVATPSSDAALRWFGGLLYVVNRFNFDNIQVLDPAAGFATTQQFSVGNGSNPHDIALVSATKAYVTRYGSPDLWIVNPQTGAHTGTVSMAPFIDADGIPEMDRLAIRGRRLFVTVQRLDRDNFFVPTDSSQVAVIDLDTDTLVDVDPVAAGIQGILLPYQNPGTELVVDPAGWLLVGCAGDFGVLDGGVVRINPGTLAVAGTEITEAALGGDLGDVAVSSAQRGFAVVSDASFATLLKAYNRSTGAVTGPPIYSTPDFSIADIEVNDRGELWVCDRSPGNPGVRVFDAATGAALTATPLATGLPPQDITFDSVTTLDVPGALGPPSASPLALIGSFPNPATGLTRLQFRLGPALEEVEFRIYDLAGRAIASQHLGRLPAGEHTVTWDGRTASGMRAAPGAYVARVSVGAHRIAARVVRL
jgi:DNA-binding beta-propeller fold protein YncE